MGRPRAYARRKGGRRPQTGKQQAAAERQPPKKQRKRNKKERCLTALSEGGGRVGIDWLRGEGGRVSSGR